MANNVFQVKRTSTSGRTPNTTGSYVTNSQYIAAGEFALNMADGILYTSNGSAVITVGSNLVNQRITNSLTLDNDRNLNFKTVNTSATVGFRQQNDDNFVFYSTNTTYGQRAVWAIFANSDTSALSILTPITFNGNVNQIVANGTLGTAGQVLASNGSGIYWTSSGSGSGTVTSVGSGDGLTGGPITTSGTILILANTGVVANSTGLFVNATYIGTLSANNTTFVNGKTEGNLNVNNATTAYSKAESALNVNSALTANNSTNLGGVAAASYQTTAGLSANVATLTANNANFVKANNGITSNSLGVFVTQGTGTVVNATGVHVNATYIGTLTANNATNLNGQAASFYTNATNITTGTLPYAQIPANIVNTTGSFTLSGITTFGANVVLGSSGLSANGGFGTAGQTLHSNGTAAYWAADDNAGGTVTSVASGNGLTGGPITSSGTLSVSAQTPLVANATGLHIATSAGNGSFSSGISAITVDSVGRVTSVTGSAGYVTSSGVTSVATGNGITGGTITTTGTVSILANTGVVANATGLFVNATYIGTLSANNTTFVNGKTEGNLNVNNATTAYSKTEGNLNVNNATTAYSKTEGNLNVNNALIIRSTDSRAVTTTPETASTPGLRADFKQNSTESLPDGGTYFGELTFRPYGSTTDWSGGPSHQLGFTSNNNIYFRSGNSTTWGSWKKIVDANTNTTFTGIPTFNANVVLGAGLSANGGFGTAGQVLTSNGTTGSPYWAAAAGGGYYKGGSAAVGTLAVGGQNLFRVNANTLNYNTTIAAGENAQATGPIAVASGITLTVASGARVAIV